MTYYVKNGNSFSVTSNDALDIHDVLPPGNYTVAKNPMTEQLYLETIDSFNITGKLYGTTTRHTDRILNTFNDRPASTGVMLAGEKGSGKSLLAKNVAFEGAKLGYPTIVINAPWCGDEFNTFIQKIDQPTIILFDEFEKVYDKEDQEKVLTLLDGVFPSKKLFVLTCNDKYRVDEHMRNRPGRIYYMIDFKGLSSEFIVEYCNDNLINKSHIDQIVKISVVFDQLNFDMLKALVEEMNRYGESPQEAMSMLNAKPEFGGNSTYNVRLFTNGVEYTGDKLSWFGNPLTKHIYIEYRENCDVSVDPDGWHYANASFTAKDLKEINHNTNVLVYVNDDNKKIIMTREHKQEFNYFAL